MKRKIFGLLLAVMLSAGALSGCSSSSNKDEEAIKTLNDALEKTNEEASSAGAMSMSMNMESGGEEMSIEMAIDFIINNADDEEKMEADMGVTMNMYGTEYEGKMYMKDGKTYMDMYDSKTISSADSGESMSEQTGLTEIDEDSIESAQIETKDGKKVITIELSEKAVKELVMDQLSEDLSSSGLSEDNIAIKDYKIEYVVGDDGYIYEQDISFSLKLTVDDESATLDMKANVTYTSFGEQKIEFPDFSEYVEE